MVFVLLNPKKILAFSLSFAVALTLLGNGCNGVKYRAQNAENTVQINTNEASSDNSYGAYRDLYKDKKSDVSEIEIQALGYKDISIPETEFSKLEGVDNALIVNESGGEIQWQINIEQEALYEI